VNYKTVLSIDPSGSFYEGKGTTGWCLFDAINMEVLDIGTIHAADYDDMEAYWDAHIELIKEISQDFLPERILVIIEDYVLYKDSAQVQTNSRMETSKLIGVIQHYCWRFKIHYWMQLAAEVKPRWSDSILEHKGILVKQKGRYIVSNRYRQIATNGHIRDAIRHAVHYCTFKNK
jgi:hypothetical protein